MLNRNFKDLESLAFVVKTLYNYLTQDSSHETSDLQHKENKGKNKLSQSQKSKFASLSPEEQEKIFTSSSTNPPASAKQALIPANILVKIELKDPHNAAILEQQFKEIFKDRVEFVTQHSNEEQNTGFLATLNSWKETAIFLIQSSDHLYTDKKTEFENKINKITAYFNNKIQEQHAKNQNELLKFALGAFQEIIFEATGDTLKTVDLTKEFTVEQTHLRYQNQPQKVVLTLDQDEMGDFKVKIDRFNRIIEKDYQDLVAIFAAEKEGTALKNILRKNTSPQIKDEEELEEIFSLYQLIADIISNYKNTYYQEPTYEKIVEIFAKKYSRAYGDQNYFEKVMLERFKQVLAVFHPLKNAQIIPPELITALQDDIKITIPAEITNLFRKQKPQWFKNLKSPQQQEQLINLFAKPSVIKSKEEIEQLSNSEFYALKFKLNRYQESTTLVIYPAENRLVKGGTAMRPYKTKKNPQSYSPKNFQLSEREYGVKFLINSANCQPLDDKKYLEQKNLLLEPKLSDLEQHFIFQIVSLRRYIEAQLYVNEEYSKEKEQQLAPLIRYFNRLVELHEHRKDRPVENVLRADKAFALYALLTAYNPIVKAYRNQLKMPNYVPRLATLLKNDFRFQLKLEEKSNHVGRATINTYIKSIVDHADKGTSVEKPKGFDKNYQEKLLTEDKFDKIFAAIRVYLGTRIQDNKPSFFRFFSSKPTIYNQDNYKFYFSDLMNVPIFAKKVVLYSLLIDEKPNRDKKFQTFVQGLLGNFDTNLKYLKNELDLEIRSELWRHAQTTQPASSYEDLHKYFNKIVIDEINKNYKKDVPYSPNDVVKMKNVKSMVACFETYADQKNNVRSNKNFEYLEKKIQPIPK